MHSWVLTAISTALAESDCEAIDSGWLAQPVNAITSLAFSVVGVAIVVWSRRATGAERRFRTVLGVLLVATGIGSFLYHGPQPIGSQLAHDVTFLAALALIAAADLRAGLRLSEWTQWVGTAAFAIIAAVVTSVTPEATNVFTGLATVGVIASHFVVRRNGPIDSRALTFAVSMLAIALLFFLVGRTDGPLCDSGSVLQGHGAWHVFSALAIGAYAVATAPARTSENPL
ncbi:MAG: ceramidase domain-containing protein [Acidimicrobiia bacterium]